MMPSSQPTLAQAIHLARVGNTPAAVAALRQILKADPDNLKALLALGALTPHPGEGIIALERAVRLDADNDLARRALAERRARQEEREGRSGVVEAATKRDPEEPARSPVAPTPPPAAWEIPAAPPDERLRVVAGSTYLLKQETKMHRQRTALGTLLFGLLAAGVLVGLAPLVAAILRPGGWARRG
jgi:hypothetical protein